MLNRDIDRVVLGEDGKVIGVEADGIMAKTNLVIGDPSYFPDRVRKVQKVIRAIAIMDHPLPETNGSPSCQVIFPQGQVSCSYPNKPGLLSDLFLFIWFPSDQPQERRLPVFDQFRPQNLLQGALHCVRVDHR
jgi:hypothetical protein